MAINKTEGSEFTIHGKAQLSREGDFYFSWGEMHHCSGTKQFFPAGCDAEKLVRKPQMYLGSVSDEDSDENGL